MYRRFTLFGLGLIDVKWPKFQNKNWNGKVAHGLKDVNMGL